MFHLVMDDKPRRSDGAARTPGVRSARTLWLLVAAVGTAPLGIGSALAQEDEQASEFTATVLDMSNRMQRVMVPLYGSVTVETTSEVLRADVVANQIADVRVVSPTRLHITGQAYGTTTVALLREDKAQYVFEVTVELDLGRLNDGITQLDPQSDVTAKSVLGNIVLTGSASSAERAARIVELASLFLPRQAGNAQAAIVQNHLDVAGEQQVLLRCVVAEVNRTAARELGINGFLAGENFRDGFLVNQIGQINPINMGAGGGALVTRNIPFFTDEDGISISPQTTLSLGFPRVQMQMFIRALADNSLLKVLAEPNLVAISGETATFLAGGEFPVPEPQGFQTVTIRYREFGVRLNFTPVVRGHQRIRLRVNPEVSELDFSSGVQLEGFIVPGLRSRASETTVELGNGETIAIAGLLSEQVRGFASRVPAIGDIPILGSLFRSVQYQRSLSELVILVTPEIVAPLDGHQDVRLPGDDSVDPSDSELYLLGLLEGEEESSGGVAQADGATATLASEPQQLSVHGPWGHTRSNGAR